MHPVDTWENDPQNAYSTTHCLAMTLDLLTSKSNQIIFVSNCTWDPIFEKSYDELTKNLGWARDYRKIVQKSYEKVRTKLRKNLWKAYEDITGILRRRKIRDKWRHSGNCYLSNTLS